MYVALVAVVALLPLAWYLGSPLFLNQAVNEQAPATVAASRVLGKGQFGVVDAIHRGEGTARLLELSDGQRVLRLEDFRVTNGPDLYVYLSAHPAPRMSADLHQAGAFEVAPLKGNIGG
ncbi:MAG TPA: DM13 domain-containing protein, partial [Chloroflexota bacterium]|nr:DM13 domain-containing protein [Chloroflexota bacterium]